MFDPVSLAIYVGLTLVSQTWPPAERERRSPTLNSRPPIQRKTPYVAGTAEISPQVIGWGDFQTLFSLHRIQPGFELLLADHGHHHQTPVWVSLLHRNGPRPLLRPERDSQSAQNGRPCHLGRLVTGGSFTVAKPGEFGADGGVYAVCDHVPGSMSQNRNAYWNTIRPNVPPSAGPLRFTGIGPSSRRRPALKDQIFRLHRPHRPSSRS